MKFVPVGLLLLLALSGCVAGSTPNGPSNNTPTSAAGTSTPSTTPAPTSSSGNDGTAAPTDGADEPFTPQPAADDVVNGVNAVAAWNACVEQGRDKYTEIFVSNSPYSLDAVQPVDAQVAGASGVIVTTQWVYRYQGKDSASIWTCNAAGDPNNPTVLSIEMPDK